MPSQHLSRTVIVTPSTKSFFFILQFAKQKEMCNPSNPTVSNEVPSIRAGDQHRRIAFASRVLVFEIRCIDDMAENEKKDVWYDAHDYASMKGDRRSTISLITAQQVLNHNTHCTRGLEAKLPGKMRRARRRTRSEAMFAVLDEQETQWIYNANDSKALSEVYKNYSAPCRAVAHRIAQLDEFEAFAVHGISRTPGFCKPFRPKQSTVVLRPTKLPRQEKMCIASVA